MKYCTIKLSYFLFLLSYFSFTSCTSTRSISQSSQKLLLSDTAISKGFIGISIYDPAENKYLYNYNADKYFVPASNTKLFSLYAGMKYLGDSLTGLRYSINNDSSVLITATGDPTFLHPDFSSQKVFDFLRNTRRKIAWNFNTKNNFNSWGPGWAWNDFSDDYMLERNTFPMYGNRIKIFFDKDTLRFFPKIAGENLSPSYNNTERTNLPEKFGIKRTSPENNGLTIFFTSSPFKTTFVSMRITDALVNKLMEDTLHNEFGAPVPDINMYAENKIHSQPSDSLFKPMMHNSDNFFAEQTLLMASNEFLHYMSDEKMIDTLLKKDLKDIPQKPRWVDGSGLSRYNLFTPQDFIYILQKMKDEFGFERMKVILPTGGEGTLTNYFKNEKGSIYAKTGTLSNNCALSGYIITKKNKLLIFSILANNYQTGATPVRKAEEKFLKWVMDSF